MALRGNLRDFSLPDVFQLVTFSRKTGVLRIARADGAAGSVWFRDGDVFFASSNWHSDPLGERLVKSQRITPQALKRAIEIRSEEPEDGRRIGQILIDEGYITDRVLEQFVSDQIQDTIFDLMRWDEGDFDFEAMPEVVEEDIGLAVSIENVVMEGSRRLEEWTRIKKKIPSSDVVFKMATAPGEGTFEIALKPAEWQLLLLVDGSRSVAELAQVTNRTDFEVARVLYGLFSAGLLEFATDEEIEKNRTEREEREARLAEIMTEKRAAEEKAKAEALAREAKLAEEAAARRAAQKAQAEEQAKAEAEAARLAVETAAIEAARAARTEPEEEPEFLIGGTVPTAADEAVLEEFMGAVLEKPVEKPVEEPAPVVAPEPYVPAEEPAFMGVEHLEEDDLIVGVPSVEDLFPEMAEIPHVESMPAVEPVVDVVAEPVAEPEGFYAPELAALEAELSEAEPGADLAVETPVDTIVPESEAEPEGPPDFERDLLALGLGELPGDLLEPLGAPQEPEVEELVSAVELAPEPPVSEPQAVPEDAIAALTAEMELPEDLVAEPMSIIPESAEPDFSALLESLDVDAEEVEPPSPVEAGFDLALLEDEDTQPAGAGVISTDAFLDDISIDDELGFSGGLTDELSALTGAERRGPARPQASVKAIPEEGSSVLHRDARVDKSTVLKIIDGIKNL